MAYGGGAGDCIDITLPAAADLSSYQYKFMTVDANGRGTPATANTAVIAGILQNKPAAADTGARIRVAGISKLVFGAAANEAAFMTANGEGFGTPTAVAGCFTGAVVIAAVGGSADIGDVFVRGFTTPY